MYAILYIQGAGLSRRHGGLSCNQPGIAPDAINRLLQKRDVVSRFSRIARISIATVKKNYVLIDYENVQPAAMEALEREHFHVIVFVGASQAKVTYEVADVMQRMGERAAYIKISGNGSNALDFHIAYYIGELASSEPDACFHIVSKDAGFDPLVQHLKSRKVRVGRVKSVNDLPLIKAASSISAADRVSAVVTNLKQRESSRPRTVKTLGGTINALFQKKLTESEVEEIIAELTRRGIVLVNQTKVAYALPA
jgi:uncharacterized LabA/DUF88 family protein